MIALTYGQVIALERLLRRIVNKSVPEEGLRLSMSGDMLLITVSAPLDEEWSITASGRTIRVQ